MAEYFISYDDAQGDLLSAAAYLGERTRSGDGRAEAMNAVVPRFLAGGNVDLAAELANTVDDPFTRDRLLVQVAEKCAELDDDDYALQLADAIEDDGLRSQAHEQVALEKVRKGQIDKALEMAASMAHPDYVLASAAVHHDSQGAADSSSELLEQVEYPGARVAALQAIAMNKLAAGDPEECVSLLDAARRSAADIEHNEERIRTLCDIGNHLADAGRNDLAIAAYDAARQEAEQLDNMHRDSFLAAAAMGFLHAGSIDLADRTLDLVTDKTQMSNCLLAFARYYWAKDEREEAVEALDEAYQILRSQRDIETRDSRARYALFAAIAAQFAGFEKGERAIEIAQAIDDDAQRTAALSQIAAILTLRKEDEQARQAMAAIANDADRAFALIATSDAKEKNGDRPAAIEVLDKAVHLVEDVPQLTSRAFAYNEIAGRFVKYGETQRAIAACSASVRTISEVRDEGSRVVSLAALSDLVNENQELELAEDDIRVIEKMLARP
jgi:hypothetical protein